MDRASIDSQGYGMVTYGPTDDKLIVGFYKKSVLNAAQSRSEGKPIYDGVDFVKIEHPGENLNKVDRPVRDDDKRRWPQRWAQYEQGITQRPSGVPLSLLFVDKPQIVDMMRGYNIHTVEQLSNLSAQAISTVGMGCQDWVNAAKRYMEQANKGVNHHQHEQDLAARDSRIALLERSLAEVTALVRQQHAAPAPNATHPFDAQTAQINATHPSETDPFTQPAAQFIQDLSGQVTAPKRRGRPPKAQH